MLYHKRPLRIGNSRIQGWSWDVRLLAVRVMRYHDHKDDDQDKQNID
jgi:hypothetical protein